MATSSDKSRVGRPSGTSATAEKACFCCCWNCCGCEAADSTTLLFVVVDAVGVLFSHVRNGKTLETKFLNPPPNALVSFIFFSSFFAANFSVLASMFAIHLDAQFFLYSSSSNRFVPPLPIWRLFPPPRLSLPPLSSLSLWLLSLP